ncbi:MAG: hypothetical protein R8M45_01375, partial [Ghiorsea sp.]
MKAITTGLAILLSMGSAWAGTLTTPNTFYANTAARAQMINDNFTAAKTAVDDNDSRISANTITAGVNTGDINANASATTVNAIDISNNATAVTNEATRA